MPTRTKTVEFAHAPLASMVDNTLTPLSAITVFLPETGKTFRSVMAIMSANGTATAAGNVTTRRLECRLGAAAFTAHTNSNLYTGSGEDIHVHHAVDLTAHFTTNWTGTSMTFDSSALCDGTATAIAWTNICVTLYVTYDYDDTSATQIKTVRLPLNAPITALATTKPGTANATIPDLDVELPEASKVFRNHFITVQGNRESAATTDNTITMQLDSTTAFTSGIFEGGQNTGYFYRLIWHAPTLDFLNPMGFFIWGSATDFDHPQVWLTVTYEFDATAANQVYVSVILPMEIDSPMGGTAAADKQRGARDLMIQEPGAISTRSVAFFPFWTQAADIAGLNMRVGTGAYVAYSSVSGAEVAGSCAAMVRNDSAFTLARGRNSLTFDIYRTDTADLGYSVSGFWIVNYTANKPTQGYGAANHTIRRNLGFFFDGATANSRTTAALNLGFIETEYYLTSVGLNLKTFTNSTAIYTGMTVLAERLAAEGGIDWQAALIDLGHTDPETGLMENYCTMRSIFKIWPTDPRSPVVPSSARRYRTAFGGASSNFQYLDALVTYHGITYAVAGTVTGFTGTVNIDIYREATGEKVLSTSRSGDGAYSLTWYDNTELLFAAVSDGTTVGRSPSSLAT